MLDQAWFDKRKGMEASGRSHSLIPTKTKKNNDKYILFFIRIFEFLLKISGVYFLLNQKALDIKKTELSLKLKNFPLDMGALRIAQLSDLHIDERPDITDKIITLLKDEEIDFLFITGDFVSFYGPHREDILTLTNPIEKILNNVKTKYGVYAVPGNHDSAHVIKTLADKFDIKFLINERVEVKINNQILQLIGTDDIYYYYTEEALEVFDTLTNDFSIALIHSPDLHNFAHEKGIDFYLCGHTHAGQVSLPGGKAIITQTLFKHDKYKGIWNIGKMTGYTSSGVGTCASSIRLNTRGEVVIFELSPQKNTP